MTGRNLAIAIAAMSAIAGAARGPAGAANLGGIPAQVQAMIGRLSIVVDKYQGIDLGTLKGFGIYEDIERAGLELVGSGGSRLVVGLGPQFVAKVDYEPGRSANRAEERNWLGWREQLSGHVVPVVGTLMGGRILIMERASPLHERDNAALRRARQAMPLRFDEADFNFNWGRHEGAVKLLDYVS